MINGINSTNSNIDNIFFIAEYNDDEDRCNGIHFGTFAEEYSGDICLFQFLVNNNGANVDPTLCNILHPKHSLQATVEAFMNDNDPTALQHQLVGILLNQMSAKAGIKKHGKRAEDVLFTEFLQIDNMHVFIPAHRKDLTIEQIRKALRAISVIKEKRDGTLKGRTCAVGTPQREYYDKTETASPTVHADSFMLTTAIEAKEDREIGTGDIVGAFLHALEKDFTVIKFVNEQVDILCRTNTKYEEFVTVEGKNKVIYLMLDHALYGTLTAAIRWYELLTSTLVEHGFKLNPYDFCVANSVINDKQCTIIYHVDDTKVSHVGKKVVEDVFSLLEAKFGKMKIKYGKDHEFLGMKIKYQENGTFKIGMKSYLEDTIKEFGKEMIAASTPARSNLFTVNNNLPLVDER